jgi:omega-hydroxy-beta-dihydromenaquinone-9 sulfotransferase
MAAASRAHRPSFAHPLCGADLRTLTTALAANGVPPRRWPQVAFILLAALGRLPFTTVERLFVAWRRRHLPPMPPPVFILGHWRSGTTHVFNVLSRDPKFAFITPVATGIPWDFLTLGRLLRPLLEQALPAHRVIDRVAVLPDSPQEDEIGLASMTPLSYYHGLYFPRRFREQFDRSVFLDGCTPAEIDTWARAHVYYAHKVALAAPGRRLLIKNPVYTARVTLLRQVWPEAKFIHVYRNPFEIFESTRNFYDKLLPELALQDADPGPLDEFILATYRRLMERFFAESADLPEGTLSEIRFETFEADPIGELERVYRTLGLDGFAGAQPRFVAYLDSVRDYRKNRYELSGATIDKVGTAWQPYLRRWGYDVPEGVVRT